MEKQNLKKIIITCLFLSVAGTLTACQQKTKSTNDVSQSSKVSDPTKISDKEVNKLVENARESVNKEYKQRNHDNQTEILGKNLEGISKIDIYFDKARDKYIINFDDDTDYPYMLVQTEKDDFKDFKQLSSEAISDVREKQKPFKTIDIAID